MTVKDIGWIRRYFRRPAFAACNWRNLGLQTPWTLWTPVELRALRRNRQCTVLVATRIAR